MSKRTPSRRTRAAILNDICADNPIFAALLKADHDMAGDMDRMILGDIERCIEGRWGLNTRQRQRLVTAIRLKTQEVADLRKRGNDPGAQGAAEHHERVRATWHSYLIKADEIEAKHQADMARLDALAAKEGA